jgi:sulfate adenylyltransferase
VSLTHAPNAAQNAAQNPVHSPADGPADGRADGSADGRADGRARDSSRDSVATPDGRAAPAGGGLPAPHGGTLTARLADPDRAGALAAEALNLPAVPLDPWALADLECLAVGGFSPLTGFLGPDDYASVVHTGRLSGGQVWTLPIVLAVPDDVLAGAPDRLALTGPDGTPLAVLDVHAVHDPDPAEPVEVFGTDDDAHPGVAAVRRRSGRLVGGPVEVIALPPSPGELGPRLTPAQVRAEAASRGWRTMVGFQTRNPVHRAHEYLHKVALEQVDGLLLHPLVGQTKGDDVPAALRMACYRALLDRYYPTGRVLLSAFPAAMRYAGPREAVFHAVVRKNYGCSHLIVGRDHAGVGSYYGTYDAQRAFDAYAPGELGIAVLPFEHAFWCQRCEGMATTRTCPHDADSRVHLSGTAVRELLRSGERPPPEFSRPEVADLLIEGYRS